MKKEAEDKAERILSIYSRLKQGKVINKENESIEYGVSSRTIQRDIDDIRCFLCNHTSKDGSEREKDIVYDRANKGFKMVGIEDSVMTNSEILGVSKILLESRAFTKEEMDGILEKLVRGCASKESKKTVNDAIRNEQFHYVELRHKSSVLDKLWELNEAVQQCELLEITYQKAVASKETVIKVVEPVAILFSDYYFYLNAYIVEKNEMGRFVHAYENPTIYRIDRLKKHKKVGQKFKTAYANRFEEGEYRKRVQFMYAGNLHKCRFLYRGRNKEAVLDRFPTAILLSEDEKGCVFEVETYGRGMMMWLLSQGVNAEVLWPDSYRERVKKELEEMLERYE